MALRGAGLSAGEDLKGLSESTRGASGLVLAIRGGSTSRYAWIKARLHTRYYFSKPWYDDLLSEDDNCAPLLDVLGPDAMGDVIGCIATEKEGCFK